MKASPKKFPHKYRIWGRSGSRGVSDCQALTVITLSWTQ